MIKGSAFPGLGAGAVAGCTIRGKASQLVIGIRGVLKVGQMTADTFRGAARIDPIGVTIETVCQQVLSAQNE
jgi:hypothetical protein